MHSFIYSIISRTTMRDTIQCVYGYTVHTFKDTCTKKCTRAHQSQDSFWNTWENTEVPCEITSGNYRQACILNNINSTLKFNLPFSSIWRKLKDWKYNMMVFRQYSFFPCEFSNIIATWSWKIHWTYCSAWSLAIV